MSNELYRGEDESGCIVVTQQADKRILSFGSDLQQSCICLSEPWRLIHEYTRIMLLGLIFVEAKQVTILGLGGGGLVHCLNHFYPAINLKVVELRQLVINVAVEWFTLPVEESLQVFCDDAQYYMARVEPAETDLIFSDLYQASGMSEVQQQTDFISHCSKALTDNGCLIINYHSMPNNSEAVMQQIQSLFSSVYICDVFKGNQVLFCIKTRWDYDKKELKTSLSKLEKKVEIPLMYYFKKLREYKW